MYFIKLNGERVVDIIKNPPPNLTGGVYVEELPKCEVQDDEKGVLYYKNCSIVVEKEKRV